MGCTLITDSTPIILLDKKREYTDAQISDQLNIPLDMITFYSNFLAIDKKWYYYKLIKNNSCLLNELLGVLLAKHFGNGTVEYRICKFESESRENINNHYLLSENFRKKTSEYFFTPELDIPNFETGSDSLENLKNLRSVCSSENNYKQLMSSIIKMFMQDFYSSQTDRHYINFMFEKRVGELFLCFLYDYEQSFWSASDVEIRNSLFRSNIYSSNTSELFNAYPEMYKIFRSILDIDIENMLKIIGESYCLDIDKKTRDKYLKFDDKRKQLVRRF